MNSTCNLLIIGNQLSNKNHYWQQNILPTLRTISTKLFLIDIVYENICSNVNKTEKKITALIKKEEINHLLLLTYETDLTFNYLYQLKERIDLTCYAFFSDNDWRFRSYDSIMSSYFNFNFVTYRKHLSNFITKNAILTQWAAIQTENIHHDVNYEYDVSFIGQAYGERITFIKELINSGIKVTIFGSGWDKYPELARYYKGYLSSDDFIKTIQESKINLNFAWGSKDGELQIKGRTFELSAYGGFQLTNRNSELLDYFVEDQEIVFFNDIKDAIYKIKQLLPDEEKRNNIIKNAHYRIENNHLWNHRVSQAIADINKQPKQLTKKPIPVFSLYQKSYYLDGEIIDSLEEYRKNLDFAYIYYANSLGDCIEFSYLKLNDSNRKFDHKILMFNLKFYFLGLLFTSRFSKKSINEKLIRLSSIVPWNQDKVNYSYDHIEILDCAVFTKTKIPLKYCFMKQKLTVTFFKERKKIRRLLSFGIVYLYLKLRYKR